MANQSPDIIPYGDSAFLVRFHNVGYSDTIIDKIHALKARLGKDNIWTDVIAGYDSLMVCFSPLATEEGKAYELLKKQVKAPAPKPKTKPRTFELPIVYGGEFGPDMETIKASSSLSEDKIIALHSDKPYRVCMMGFLPGFTFLSEAPKALHHPRHDTPRVKVPAGSVGIAGWQTGIYGLSSPGGWQIIGRTPSKLFDPKAENPFLVSSGDFIKFVPARAADFDDGETS